MTDKVIKHDTEWREQLVVIVQRVKAQTISGYELLESSGQAAFFGQLASQLLVVVVDLPLAT